MDIKLLITGFTFFILTTHFVDKNPIHFKNKGASPLIYAKFYFVYIHVLFSHVQDSCTIFVCSQVFFFF